MSQLEHSNSPPESAMSSLSFNPRFLVTSLGNKAPYQKCLHSAGHVALQSLRKSIGSGQSPFTKDKSHRALRSDGEQYTLMQSPTLMNVSGPWVSKALKQHLHDKKLKPDQLSLVVVHDDLEEAFGVVKIRKWNASHRGHNGIKSINSSMKPSSYPGARWHRISIGIGRPVARDYNAVSDFVLSDLSAQQLDTIDREVGAKVLACLQTLEEDWDKAFWDAAAKQPSNDNL